ncbi:MAG: hypothetical protein AVDCRST_MAG25-3218 [uncultured Rubrobacteraceae bacterium]|uniref:Uncharacterized protein n=1 Tax=uncultured Rubrobacteraceae bacterium TaxID=349277 RepID=A0A6J4S2S2_9ACTN|nr:MAG: hypothetical protein AVDCRST_MAG25-3218 [uncultured Rubrobacteraceae bacterium]
MAEKGFRLPGSGYEELLNIILAYGTRDGASNPGDVGKLDPAHQASATRNNAFLTGIGVLEGGEKKLVTDRGRALARSLWRGTPEEARRQWREVVSTDEFLQNIVSAVKLRNGMSRAALLAYIANAARVPRNNPTMSGAAAVVEILKASGLLREDEGRLVASFGEPPVPDDDLLPEDSPGTPDGELHISVSPADSPRPDAPAEVSESIQPDAARGPEARVVIQVQVRCTADEVEELGPKLRKLLKDISGPLA